MKPLAAAPAFRRKLAAWYRRNHRKLPWRETRDPYRVLVSELMLQQTQVSRVLGYYDRFLQRFPDMHTLAAARPAQVREQWEGLGYYARARNLHALARHVTATREGIMPSSPVELQTLPGVGRYTAGAVASFAFEKRAALVDTNVARVLRRVFSPRGTPARMWAIAEAILPASGKAAWVHNQAVMELGALVCGARVPKCGACPVRNECRSASQIQKR
jgi:A/G-specific adenine glycosylase